MKISFCQSTHCAAPDLASRILGVNTRTVAFAASKQSLNLKVRTVKIKTSIIQLHKFLAVLIQYHQHTQTHTELVHDVGGY